MAVSRLNDFKNTQIIVAGLENTGPTQTSTGKKGRPIQHLGQRQAPKTGLSLGRERKERQMEGVNWRGLEGGRLGDEPGEGGGQKKTKKKKGASGNDGWIPKFGHTRAHICTSRRGNDEKNSAPWTVPQSEPDLVDFTERGNRGGGGAGTSSNPLYTHAWQMSQGSNFRPKSLPCC